MTDSIPSASDYGSVVHSLPDDCVFIAGGGPVGMVTAMVLAFYGVKSVVYERNMTTTRWPKMDLTNARSMELFRRLKLADSLRTQGVPPEVSYNVIFSPGLSEDAPITQWNHPSVDACRATIKSNNDGTQPLEPYQRISQAVFEAWMREQCDANPLIDLRFGSKVESVVESSEHVEMQVVDMDTGTTQVIRSKFMVACDGAGSRTRRALNIPLDGGPTPATFLLVHFKSRDLERLHKQGRFWHLFMLQRGVFAGAVISQDEREIFTVHYPLAPAVEESSIKSEEAVYTVLGGKGGPYPINIDEIIVRSTYRPSIAVARRFAGPELRVFLAGDSAHQNIPAGGYGMNTGLGDAYDIGWKIASVVKGYARKGILLSYEQERRPVALTNVERSGVHMTAHMEAVGILAQVDDEAEATAAVHKHYQEKDGENKDLGIEMGYRYSSVICLTDDGKVPPFNPHRYTPTTLPGSRPPHVFLNDGTALFDHFGNDFTLVEFAQETPATSSGFLGEAAKVLDVPMIHLLLSGENHAAQLWEKTLILVRPDGHVAWRGESIPNLDTAKHIIETAVGYHYAKAPSSESELDKTPSHFTFTESTITQTNEYVLEGMGDLQK